MDDMTTLSPQDNPLFYVFGISLIAAITGLLFGFDTGIISGAIFFIRHDFHISTAMQEFIVSAVLIGAMIGSLLSGRMADQLGRRPVLLIISSLFILGTLITSFAFVVPIILIGRLIIGIAIGMGCYIAPLYIAEIAPVALRGSLVSLNQLAITIGILCSYIINYLFTTHTDAWRWMFGIGIIPALLLAFGMMVLPESPRWLIKQDRISKAEKILKRIRRSDDIKKEIDEIQNSLQLKNASINEVFAPWIRSVLFLGAALGFIQQVTGINTIIYYSPSIFTLAGYHSANAILPSIWIGAINVIATFFAILFLDKWGRRPLLLTGLVGMCMSLLGLSLSFYLGTDTSSLSVIALCCTFSYITCFAFSLGAILWLIVSEIFPLEVRATAMGFALLSCWFWNFAVSATFLTLLEKFGPAETFFLYAVMCILSFIFCLFKVPETKQVSLEQIENNIRAGKPLRYLGEQPKRSGHMTPLPLGEIDHSIN